MKLIPIRDRFINLDSIEQVLTREKKIIFNSGNELEINDDDLEVFVKEYNLYDTDELAFITKRMADVLFNNPIFMTKEGMLNDIRLKVERYDLKDFVKDYNKDKKIKDLTHVELVNLYKALVEKIQEDMPF